MTISRQKLYAFGEAFGDSATCYKPGGRIYGGGGGNSGGTSSTMQSIPDELKPLASAYTGKAIGLTNEGFTPYGGDRYEGLNGTQNLGIGMTQGRAMNGDATVNAGRSYLQSQLNSGPQQATSNAFAQSGGQATSNAFAQSGAQATSNPYAQQQNPYLDSMVKKAQASVLGNAQAADMRSGSFGNSGVAEQAARQMGEVATNMYGNAYNGQAQLAESGASRNDALRQLQANLAESGASRNDSMRQLQANLMESGASRNDAMLQNYRSNNLNAAQLGLGYGDQAYKDAGQLMKAGQIQQDQGQQGRDFQFSQFQEQQNKPYKDLAAMSGVFGSNLGSSSSTTQTGGGGK